MVKDAGDDLDVTNGAEIGAEARWLDEPGGEPVVLVNGPGVGGSPSPVLPVAVGEPAINPVPRRMIRAAVAEALVKGGTGQGRVEVRVFA